MRKLTVKKLNNTYKYVIGEDGEPVIYGDFSENNINFGDICAGVAKDSCDNLGAAFFDIGSDKNAFMQDAKKHAGGEKTLLQIVKVPHDQKGASVTDEISMFGCYVMAVFIKNAENNIKISSKIKEKNVIDELTAKVAGVLAEGNMALPKNYGITVTVRTLGGDLSVIEKTAEELRSIILNFRELYKEFKGKCGIGFLRKCDFMTHLLSVYRNVSFDEILTDSPDTSYSLSKQLPFLQKNIHSLTSASDVFFIDEAANKLPKLMGRRVYLKSGGEIVIDKTEALTAIDVNSGSSKKSADENNEEAAREVMRQLMLRNIGGTIIVDFISVKDKASREKLLTMMRELAKRDYNLCMVEGFTKLELCEIARKRN